MLKNDVFGSGEFTGPGNHPDSSSGFSTPLLTVEEVADYLKLQPETIRCMARRGELPAIKFGKVWRFQMAAIHRMLHETSL